MAPHLPPREPDVLTELACVFDSSHAPISPFSECAAGRAHAFDVAHPPLRLAPGVRGAEPAVDVLARPHLEMKRQLVVDFIVDRRFPRPQVETIHEPRAT